MHTFAEVYVHADHYILSHACFLFNSLHSHVLLLVSRSVCPLLPLLKYMHALAYNSPDRSKMNQKKSSLLTDLGFD